MTDWIIFAVIVVLVFFGFRFILRNKKIKDANEPKSLFQYFLDTFEDLD